MAAPTKIISGYRVVNTRRGDTLQRIAARELGDAARWPDIALLNDLAPPYLVDDPADIAPGVLQSGASLMLPANAVSATRDASTDDLFGRDVALADGDLVVTDGDIALVSGVDNLSQAMRHLIKTEPGDLLFYPRYGCGVRPFLGASNSKANGQVAGALVRRAVLADPRIDSIQAATVEIAGDAVRIEVTAMAIHNVPLQVSA